MSAIRIEREDAAGLDDIGQLACALKAHHHAVAPELGDVRSDEDFWERKRTAYEYKLAERDGALFVARRQDGAAVGYAFAVDASSDALTWPRAAVRLEDISVAPSARGTGVGAGLMDAVRTHADGRELRLSVLSANVDALRFYDREGFSPWIVELRLPGDRSD